MGRMVDVDHLVPARLIAQRLRWKSVQSVHYYWRTDPTFPDPVYSLTENTGGLRLWCWPDVEAWADAKGLQFGGYSDAMAQQEPVPAADA